MPTSNTGKLGAANSAAEAPEAVGVGDDARVGDVASVLGGVNDAKVVRSRSVVVEVCGEHRQGEAAGNVLKEGLLLPRRDGIALAVAHANKTAVVVVAHELRADRGRNFDRLARHRHSANVHGGRSNAS